MVHREPVPGLTQIHLNGSWQSDGVVSPLDGHGLSDLINRRSLEAAATFSASNLTHAALNKIGLHDFLRIDHRPTFVLDTSNAYNRSSQSLSPIYCNPALQKDVNVFNCIQGNFGPQSLGVAPVKEYGSFVKWALGDARQGITVASFLYKGFMWAANTVNDGKWRVVSGTSYNDMQSFEDSPKATQSRRGGLSSLASKISGRSRSLKPVDTRAETRMLPVTYADYHRSRSNSPEPLERVLSGTAFTERNHLAPAAPSANFDWTRRPIEELTPHARLLRSVDWASTPLGSIADWSPQLRQAANMILADPNPALLLWGSECIMIYNEPYVAIIESYHPDALGKCIFTSLREYNDHSIPTLTYVQQTGQAVHQEDLPLFLLKEGRLVEGWFSLTFFPLLNTGGQVEGIYEQIHDSTKIEIMRRRLNAFMDLAKNISIAESMSDFWKFTVESLQKQERDVPFSLIYSIRSNEGDELNQPTACSADTTYGKYAILQASIGVPQGHKAAPVYLCLEDSSGGFMPYFRQALKTRERVVIRTSDENFPKKILENITWRGFGEPCDTFVVEPTTPTKSDAVLGFIVAGINPRRPFDEGYGRFLKVITSVLATGMASVMLLEEEVGRRKALVQESATVQAELSQQLEIKQQRIDLQERRFQRVALRADIALFITKPDGTYIYRNECWFDLFRDAKDETRISDAWAKTVSPEDMKYCHDAWENLSSKKEAISHELRLERIMECDALCRAAGGLQLRPEDRRIWVLCSAYPELNEDGSIKEIVGLALDISKQKWAERVQNQRAKDAVESKRALENFIDTTSHEMRNPLSAITQTADGLLSSALQIISTYGSVEDIPQERQKLVRFVIEAAQTIIQCSNHQKRIVDDVLTMSKLDSGLLTIFPIDSQPEAEIRHALRIFEAEAREAKVDISLNTEESYQRLGVDWVLMDPTRLLQVFVNLLTNSIKFTRLEEQRKITISIGASEEPPYDSHGARFFDTSTNVAGDPTTAPEWGQGDSLYIIITVRDTGRGLTPEEKDLLFLRFSQASPKTHVTYGGSGLGLYISRRLAEMQGGAIGFDSTLGQGSTFSYYIKVRRSLTEKPKSRLLFNGELDLRDANILEKLPELLRRSSSETGLMAMEAPGAVSSQRPKEKRRKSNRPPNLHVLVVEDNLVNQRVLAKQLRNNGCVVEVANHGVEALKHLETTHFYNVDPAKTPTVEVTEVVASPATPGTVAKTLNVVLMDWEMPVMDGVECVKKIRELQKQGLVKGHVPVIAVTANARQEQIDHALAAGFDDVCPKPCRVFDLLGRMDKLLDKLENGDEDSNDVATDVEDEESKDGSILRLVTSMQKA